MDSSDAPDYLQSLFSLQTRSAVLPARPQVFSRARSGAKCWRSALGLVLAFVGGQLVQNMLLGIRGHDPVAVFSAVAIRLGAASLAAFVPARRAAAIDPPVTLKNE